MAQTALQEIGPIDILVNNAGVRKLSPIQETSLADLDLMVGVNLKGSVLCVQAAARCMMNRKYGRISNVSSLAGVGTSLAFHSRCSMTFVAEVGLPGGETACEASRRA
jgi:NADP-dependent 3-hydroxy acid dehydrogenase YdfG